VADLFSCFESARKYAKKFYKIIKKSPFLSYFCAKNKNFNKNNIFPVI